MHYGMWRCYLPAYTTLSMAQPGLEVMTRDTSPFIDLFVDPRLMSYWPVVEPDLRAWSRERTVTSPARRGLLSTFSLLHYRFLQGGTGALFQIIVRGPNPLLFPFSLSRHKPAPKIQLRPMGQGEHCNLPQTGRQTIFVHLKAKLAHSVTYILVHFDAATE